MSSISCSNVTRFVWRKEFLGRKEKISKSCRPFHPLLELQLNSKYSISFYSTVYRGKCLLLQKFRTIRPDFIVFYFKDFLLILGWQLKNFRKKWANNLIHNNEKRCFVWYLTNLRLQIDVSLFNPGSRLVGAIFLVSLQGNVPHVVHWIWKAFKS